MSGRRRRSLSAEHRQAARERWSLLSPYHRWLIAQEMPDDLEREEEYRRRTIAALEWRNGPMQWDATLAVLAEGEAEEVDWMTPSDREPDGMTLEEIGTALAAEWGDPVGTSRERVRQIIMGALRKLRNEPIVRELFYGDTREARVYASEAEIDAALARATEAA